MPPKTRGSQSKAEETSKHEDHDEMDLDNEDEDEDDDDDDDNNNNKKNNNHEENVDQQAGTKRKSPPTDTAPTEPDTKAPKTSSSDKGSPTSKQLLNFLLSADAIPYCYPEDELTAAKSKDFPKTYSMTPPSSFTPFEHLMIAHLLSKPLSHTLGMRSIRTLLNKPYSFSTPESIEKAGEDKVWQALEDARTQHRQKTAAYIYQMGCTYTDDEVMYELSVEANERGSSGVVSHIKDTVNGLGQTGAEIFCRRIQAVDGWGEAVWPFADSKTLSSLQELGINVADGDELQTLVEEHVDWEKVGRMGLQQLTGTGRETGDDKDGRVEDMDLEQKVQVEYVVLLEGRRLCVGR